MARVRLAPAVLSGVLAAATACASDRPGPAPAVAGAGWVTGPAGRIRVDAGGAGPGVPVLLLHGLAMDRTTWRAQLEHLRATRRAAAFDLPGCGESERPSDGDYTVAARVRALGAVADALGYHRFVLVGHSYSGLVVERYAAEHPERVAGVVLAEGAFDPAAWPPGAIDGTVQALRERWDEAIAKGFAPGLVAATEATRAKAYAALAATPRDVVAASYAGMAGHDARAMLARYPGPKLSIVAEGLDSPTAVHHTAAVQLRIMRGVSHLLMMDRPEEFDAILDAFLATIP